MNPNLLGQVAHQHLADLHQAAAHRSATRETAAARRRIASTGRRAEAASP